MLFDATYISANCNQTPTISHWGKNDLICYGSCNAVLIYDPKVGSGGKVVDTLVSHKDRVNSVRWIGGNDHETELISGSSDGDAIVWTLKGIYVPFALKGHESSVNIVDGLYKAPEKSQAVVATSSMDSSVKIWYRVNPTGHFIISDTLDFGDALCVGLRMTFFPNTKSVLLACAMHNSNIQLYLESENETGNEDLKFVKSACLVGHEDWVRGLDFTINSKMELLLASSSQDNFVRLWKFYKSDVEVEKTGAPNLNTSIVRTKSANYRITTESVLTGHEGWVYSVHWNPNGLQLLSTSLDKTIIIWEYDLNVNMWTEKVRLGEVGGNTLGFYGGFFGPDGESILAHSYHGAFHMWRHNLTSAAWEPQVTVGGHFSEVVDLAWEPKGEFLVSVSADQTARIHAPWPKNDDEAITWHEIARPQVHGYDLSSLAILSRYKYASSAEEKVIRTFEAPRNFVENFRRICKVYDDDGDIDLNTFADQGPEGASVPSLGLSNKAVYGTNNENDVVTSNKDPYPAESYFTSVQLDAPPTEETLMQNTLWPEVQKLYGHGYEVYCLAASHDGRLLASACKATTKEHAAIIIWDARIGKKLQELVSHTLTVAQISFSPDDQHVLSVSRDRRWSLFRRDQKFGDYLPVATTDKNNAVHTRIIWCCAWTHDSKYFATGSRDGKIVCWTRNEKKKITDSLREYESVSNPLEHKTDSITALAFGPVNFNYYYIMAVGFEAGRIMLYHWNTENFSPLLLLVTKNAHHLTVKRLAFRPKLGRTGYKNSDQSTLQLASCGSDHSVRIYDLFLNKIK